jgi:YfiH family protein
MTLEILRSDLLAGARHGFFTRRGGASSGIYAGLNCGPGSSDQANAVSVNRGRVAEALGVGPKRLLSLYQVHSDVVVVAGREGWGDGEGERPRADAAVTDVPGLALSVLTADCAPVLLHDPEAGLVGAAHAGWRGALSGLIEATVAAMEQLGAEPRHIRAAVGPTISQRAYEVGPEFVERFLDEDREFGRFFSGGTGDRAMFDLPGFVLERLRAAGVGEAEWLGACTYSDPGRFYSYRRKTKTGEVDYGRLISAIAL